MCMAVYLAASTPLPLVPWDAERPAFHVDPLTDDDAVRVQFSRPHVVYAGSHEGCGCGFEYGRWEGEKPEQAAAARATVAALRAYVAGVLEAGEPVELYACWEGEQGEAPAHRLALTPDDLGGPAFWFEERTFAVISPAG